MRCKRCVAAAGLIGGRALIVNAIDVEAAAFWRRRGFIASKDDPLILFRSIADIAVRFDETRCMIAENSKNDPFGMKPCRLVGTVKEAWRHLRSALVNGIDP